MREIARTFADCSLPGGFHAAAAEVFALLAGFKDSTVDLDELLALLSAGPGPSEQRRSADPGEKAAEPTRIVVRVKHVPLQAGD
jgi:hypothetical protein